MAINGSMHCEFCQKLLSYEIRKKQIAVHFLDWMLALKVEVKTVLPYLATTVTMVNHCGLAKCCCNAFLAHLSTMCSVSFCDPSMSGVRRPSVRPSTISLNNISFETAYWIFTKLHRNDPWVVPYQSCSNRSSWLHK